MATHSFSAPHQEQESQVTQEEFYKLGLESNAVLRDYQLAGVNWIIDCYNNNHGCILGDEMGLGKTIQSIAYLLYLRSKLSAYRFLVVCPLSVVANWQKEIVTFAPDFNIISLVGEEELRENTLSEIKHSNSLDSVVITTPEYVLKESLHKLKWSCLVLDEAHRLKNHKSKLYTTIRTRYTIQFMLLLTGTPIQNSLHELYSLLALICTSNFPLSRIESFVSQFQAIADGDNEEEKSEFHALLKPYLLRRTKEEVFCYLPKCSQVHIYTPTAAPFIQCMDGNSHSEAAPREDQGGLSPRSELL